MVGTMRFELTLKHVRSVCDYPVADVPVNGAIDGCYPHLFLHRQCSEHVVVPLPRKFRLVDLQVFTPPQISRRGWTRTI